MVLAVPVLEVLLAPLDQGDHDVENDEDEDDLGSSFGSK